MGSDTVLGEQGADTVAGGHGEDVVDGGPGQDDIFGEYELGCSNLAPCVGGADDIRARDGERDLVACGVGTDLAQLDAVDVVRDIPGATVCETVSRSGSACATLRGGARRVCVSLGKAIARCQGRKACVRRAAAKARRQCRAVRPKSRRAGCARAVRRLTRKV